MLVVYAVDVGNSKSESFCHILVELALASHNYLRALHVFLESSFTGYDRDAEEVVLPGT